jgi:protein tyrosine phosphatase (PTP) superfamily phosphohydrolase (DUF442 family)/cytochrome c556
MAAPSFWFVLAALGSLSLAAALDEPEQKPVPRTTGPTSKTYPALHNLIVVTERIYSGGEPAGEEAFESLDRLGVKAIVSVDGATPDVKAARDHGIRYIHIPIGYDAIPAEAGAALARVMREVEGPVYIHCHHGKHRGPAAAAVACIASGAAGGQQALGILEQAGTGKEYPGLWRDVAAYKAPPAGAKLPELRETAEVGSLAAAMAKIDRTFDELKLCQNSNWQSPNEHPDIAPRAEAALIRQQFREAARLLAKDDDARFKSWLAEAEATADKLQSAIEHEQTGEAAASLQLLEKACQRCHAAYRN